MLKKRVTSFLLAACIAVSPAAVFAEGADLKLSCKSALLMDSATGTILYEANSHEKLPMASVTKIMTMLLAMEAIDSGQLKYSDMITGSAYAKSMGGSTIFLDEGEQLSAEDILKGIAVASGNDAAVAMAEHIAGSAGTFVDMMNKRASELGMKDTHFVNCNGLDADGHYSSAYDIALMSRELLKHPDIHKFTTIWMDSLRDGKFTLSNTNKLVRFYDGCTGLKTGSTSKAMFCMSATAKRDGMHLIAVVMAAPTSKQRQADASSLLNYGFSTYRITNAVKKGDTAKTVKLQKGVEEECPLVFGSDVSHISAKSSKPEIKKKYLISKTYSAPVKKGEKAGEVICSLDGKEVGRCNLVFGKSVAKMTFAYSYSKILNIWAANG